MVHMYDIMKLWEHQVPGCGLGIRKSVEKQNMRGALRPPSMVNHVLACEQVKDSERMYSN